MNNNLDFNRIYSLIILGLVSLMLPGCANYDLTKEFGKQTYKLAEAVKTESKFYENQCEKLSVIALSVQPTLDQRDTCRENGKSTKDFIVNTADVMSAYGAALQSIADNEKFSLKKDISDVGGKISSVKDPDTGAPLVEKKNADAVSTLAATIASIALEFRRQQALRVLVAQEDNAKTTAAVMRAYFLPPEQVKRAIPNAKSPYQWDVKWLGEYSDAISPHLVAQKAREPMYANYLSGEIRKLSIERKIKIEGSSSVDKKIGIAIDAWLKAQDEFQRKAFQPSSKDWVVIVGDLATKTDEVRSAIKDVSGGE